MTIPPEQPQAPPEEDEDEFEEPSFRRIPFSKEDLINAHALRNTDFKDELLMMVEEAQIYSEAKRKLRVLIHNFFSSAVLLSNIDSGHAKFRGDNQGYIDEQKSAKLAMELDMLYAKNGFKPSDMRSSDMVAILQALESHFKIAILPRTKGPTRERIINSKQSISTESVVTRVDVPPPQPLTPQQPVRKRGFGFLGG